MSVINDATPVIAQIYPLYLQVYQRSKLHFEKLTEQYFRDLGRRMGDKVRFFLWHQNQRIVAFVTCIIHGDAIRWSERGGPHPGRACGRVSRRANGRMPCLNAFAMDRSEREFTADGSGAARCRRDAWPASC